MTAGQKLSSALYVGSVSHRRVTPRRHRLRYRVFWLLLDLDEPRDLSRRLCLFSHNRFNLFSFHDRDHGDGESTPRAYVERVLKRQGIDIGAGRVSLLCMPRILGYVFNPLSIYFCHRQDGTLAALLYEVRNTFGQKHSYLIPVQEPGDVVRQRCAKAFYVSPFMDMRLSYDFRIAPPADDVSVVVAASGDQGPVLVASLTGTRRALTDAALAGVFLSHPLLTLKVMGAIHWEALKLWVKGLRLRPRPPAPAQEISYVSVNHVQDGTR